MSAEILPFRKKFEPDSIEAEAAYERIVQRMNWVNTTLRSARTRYGELERQFLENDLVARSGPRKGDPLTGRGRRQRLKELFDCRDAVVRKELEYDILHRELRAMNRDLEQWTRTYRDRHSQI